jgi:hypothetical protein
MINPIAVAKASGVWVAAFALAALSPAPTSAQAAVDQLFTIDCPVAHYNHDDPIVFQGQVGASHAHTFFGNTTTDASSTTASLLAAPSTCENGFSRADHSAYWVPTLMRRTASGLQEIHGTADDTSVRVYYRRSGDQKVTPFPRGLRMIAGNHRATSSQPDNAFHFRCRDSRTLAFIGGDTAEIPSCTQDQFLMAFLHFPDCWNGQNLDSADHKSHMTDDDNGTCPASHPVKLPALNYEISYFDVNGPSSQLALSSGGQYSLHGDFMAAWNPAVQQALINKCVNGDSSPCFGVNLSDLNVPVTPPNTSSRQDPKPSPAPSASPKSHSGHEHGATTKHSTPADAGVAAAVGGIVGPTPGPTTTNPSTLPRTLTAVTIGGIVGLGATAFAYCARRLRRR